MTVSITGVGWVTASGTGRGQEDRVFSMPDAPLPEITQKAILDIRACPRFGRMDPYSKLGLVAIASALKDASLDEWTEKRPIGLISSTLYGCLQTDMAFFETVIPQKGRLASPNLFTYTLPNCFLGDAAILFGLTGASFVINEQTHSGLDALRMALDCIVLEESDGMLAGVCDLGRPLFLSGSIGLAPGALFFVIERSPRSRHVGYGELSMDKSGALFFDGSEIETATECVKKCLEASPPDKD